MGKIVTTVLLLCCISFCAWFYALYGKESYPFYGDAMGYYMYLPSTFIYHNHKAIDWLPEEKHFDHTVRNYVKQIKAEGTRTPKGYFIIKYTYGVAAMEAPFFFIAHALEKIAGGEATGYSATYRHLLKLSSIFYALLGLLLVYQILKSFFSPWLSLLGVFILLIGTNLFWFTFYQAGMAHVPLFFLYALLFYCTIVVHKKPKSYLFLIVGLAAGLITVIRPTDIICLLLPLLYGVYDKASWTSKLDWLAANRKGVLIGTIAFLLPLLPQMLYWKKFAGSFVYFSYGSETFNWLKPKIAEGLFSFQNGWLAYTPVMLFALVGLFFLRRIRMIILPVCIILPLYVYIIYSWHCHNYINGLGSRPMIDLYPLLVVPLVAVVERIYQQKWWLRYIAMALLVFCAYTNVAYSMLQARGILNSEDSNLTYNAHMLFKWTATYADLVTNDIEQVQPTEKQLVKLKTLRCEDYEDSLSAHYVRDSSFKSRFVYSMAAQDEYHPRGAEVAYSKRLFADAQWIKCSARFYCPEPYYYFKHLFTLAISRGNQINHWYGLKIDNKIGLTEGTAPATSYSFAHIATKQWGYLYYFVRIPNSLREQDRLKLDVWNIGKQPILFDDICLELYRDK